MGTLTIFHNGKIATNSKPYLAEAIAAPFGDTWRCTQMSI